ncbi:MAG: orotidine-5'-phosphate decarboxylase [Pseudomonadaceae bacterium]|nr:orotidine-5'-phosphate decarboxylase [Pseudomonadaceae bacterium]
MRKPFSDQLEERWLRADSMLCVGLDPLPDRLPAGVSVAQFCIDIVDATAELVCAFKPQFAHFAALGAEQELAEIIGYIHSSYPDIPVILDAKRGDVPSTAERYAVEAFERYEADAVTVNPYLGTDSIEPYLQYADRGVIILARTSNEGAGWLQDQGEPVFLRVARAAAQLNRSGNVALVAGATHPQELAQIRSEVQNMPLLVPGVGSQGGDVAKVLAAGLAPHGNGLIINSSRGILYASQTDDYAQAAQAAAFSVVSDIRRALAGLNA